MESIMQAAMKATTCVLCEGYINGKTQPWHEGVLGARYHADSEDCREERARQCAEGKK